MRPSTIWYTLKQGVKNIKRNWMFSLASIITMAATLYLTISQQRRPEMLIMYTEMQQIW